MSLTALKKLAESSKATVLVGTVAILGVLVYLGKLDAQQMLDVVQYIVPAWMVAHAGEHGAKAFANGKAAPAAKPEPEADAPEADAKADA